MTRSDKKKEYCIEKNKDIILLMHKKERKKERKKETNKQTNKQKMQWKWINKEKNK